MTQNMMISRGIPVTTMRFIGRIKEYMMISFCKLPQRFGGNVVILNPLTVGSPAVEATIPGRVGSTSPTITIGMWMYFKRCAVLNDLAWKGNCIPQNKDTTWQNHHTEI